MRGPLAAGAGPLTGTRRLTDRTHSQGTVFGYHQPWIWLTPDRRFSMGTNDTDSADLALVGENIDTWIINVKGGLATDLDRQLETLKQESQDADDDLPTPWDFAGE